MNKNVSDELIAAGYKVTRMPTCQLVPSQHTAPISAADAAALAAHRPKARQWSHGERQHAEAVRRRILAPRRHP